MKARFSCHSWVVTQIVLVVGLIGCESSVDPKVLPLRQKLLVQTALADPSSISDAKKTIEEESGKTVVFKGMIKAGQFEPFSKSKAEMILSEAPADGHNHDPEHCPFCRQRAQTIVQVQFVGENGDVLAIPVPELLGLKTGQVVVVRGTGKIDEFKAFQVTAEAVEVLPVK